MAVDEALLNETQEDHPVTLRFYQWQEPTLSLGYFQNYEDRQSHSASTNAEVVRRLSGGGAIIHDQELTYSLVLPPAHPLADDTQGLYDAIHSKLVQYLQERISSASKSWTFYLCPESSALAKEEEPFLCFQRRAKGDILLQPAGSENKSDSATNHKIVGSAQRRRRGVVLQHGSILLGQSIAAPELSGIKELTGTNISVDELTDELPNLIAKSLGLNLQPWHLEDELFLEAKRLASTKYLSETWTKRR